MLSHGHAAELRERRFEIVQFQSIRPVILVRGAQNFENLEDLIDLRIAHEQRPTLYHLRENAASRPEIDSETVGLLPEQNLRAPVPERHDLVSVGLNGKAEGSGKTEVRKFDVLSLGVDEQILGLEVPMEDPVLVQVDERLQNLVQEQLRLLLGQRLVSLLLHVLFQIELEVLEDQVELVLAVDNFLQLDNVGMAQALEETNLSDGGGGHTIVFLLQSNLLKCDYLARYQIAALVNNTVGALSQFLLSLVAIQGGCLLDESLLLRGGGLWLWLLHLLGGHCGLSRGFHLMNAVDVKFLFCAYMKNSNY